MAYRAKTLTGAQRRVRQLEARIRRLVELHHRERMLLAILASENKKFCWPPHEAKAKELRDRILRDIGRL